MEFIICLVILFATIAAYFKWSQTYWSRRGIDGPPSFPIIGNYYEISNPLRPRVTILQEWTKKFGKVFGYYEGVIPVIVVSDLDMLQELFLKKFDYFYARKSTHIIHGDLESTAEEPRINVFSARGARWKRLRALSSPAFSVKALRQVHGVIDDSVNNMIELMSKHADGPSFNIHEYFQELTFDVICRLAVGQPQSEQFNNWAMKTTQAIFMKDHRVVPWYLAVILPKFSYQIKKLFARHTHVTGGDIGKLLKFICDAVTRRVKEREQNLKLGLENEENDFIDMFLNYQSDSVEDINYEKGITIEKKSTIDEVISSCFVFLLAGFDTTANTLGYTSYLFATHPEIMKKAQKEVDEVCTTGDITSDQLTKLYYLDACVREAMRLYPVAAFACSRECVKSTTLGEYKIQKGTKIEADVFSIHRSKEIWGENADQFVPERFIDPPPRHIMSWMPFGIGPRQCVGMRLGYVESKLGLASVLRKFDIVSCPETERELKLIGCTTISPEKVTVQIKSRD